MPASREQLTEFFTDGRYKANFLLNIGVADPAGIYARGPRLAFDDVVQIIYTAAIKQKGLRNGLFSTRYITPSDDGGLCSTRDR